MVRSLPEQAELVLVDNASSDGAASEVRAARPNATILELTRNDGFGAGCNVGARAAGGDVVIFLNPDCRPQPGALDLLAAAAAAEPVSAFGPALLDANGIPRHNLRRRSIPAHEILELLPSAQRWMPTRLRRDLPTEDPRYQVGGTVDYLQGACLAITRTRFLSVGGFDQDYFLYSEEETLCNAVDAAGGRCVYRPEAVVQHIGATSTERVSSFAVRHAYRSRAIFYRKRYGGVLGLASIVGIGLAALSSVLMNGVRRSMGDGHAAPGPVGVNALRGLAAGATARLDR